MLKSSTSSESSASMMLNEKTALLVARIREIFWVPTNPPMNSRKSNFTKWRKWCRFIDFPPLSHIAKPTKQFVALQFVSQPLSLYFILWLVEQLGTTKWRWVCCCNFSKAPFSMQVVLLTKNTRNSFTSCKQIKPTIKTGESERIERITWRQISIKVPKTKDDLQFCE